MDKIFEVLRSDQCDDTYQAWDLTECKKMVMNKQVIQDGEGQEQVMHNGNQVGIKEWIMREGRRIGFITSADVREDNTAKFPSSTDSHFPDAPKFYVFTYNSR